MSDQDSDPRKARGARVRQALEQNKQAFEALKALSQRTRVQHGAVTAENIAKEAKVPRQAAIQMLRELAKADCGEFKIGRRGKKTRLQPKDPQEMFEVAKCAVSSTDGPAPQGPTARPALASGTPVDEIRHWFVLRPGFTVELDLPGDLTTNEAFRLAQFIQTLPFSEKEREANA